MSKTVWRHLALLSMLAFVYVLWARASQFHRTAPQLGSGEAVYAGAIHALANGGLGWFLAVAAGIAVGTGTVGRRGVRTAVAVLAVTTLAMVALDVVVEPAATRAAKSAAKLAAKSVTTAWPGFFNDTTI